MIHKKWLVTLLYLYCLTDGILASPVLKQTPPSIGMMAVNRIVSHTLEQLRNQDFSRMPDTPYDYTVLDTAGSIFFQTSPQAPDAVSEAVHSHDTVLDVTDTAKNLQSYGKVLTSTSCKSFLALQHRRLIKLIPLMSVLLLLMVLCCTLHLNRMIFTPFQHLEDFAHHIAMGNLDAFLPMDEHHIFEASTESLDIVRKQLTGAGQRETRANRSRKELVASSNHDIETPIISIELASKLVLVTEWDTKAHGKIQTVYNRPEQTNRLMTDMFQATLEDLGELQVILSEESSALLKPMIHHSDFYGRVTTEPVPGCLLFVGIPRIGQVIDNITNSAYKYASTPITVHSKVQNGFLRLEFIDYGDGTPEEELPKLFQKFYHGNNSQVGSKNDSGLGLYITHRLTYEMEDDIQCYNYPNGFSVEVLTRLTQFST